MEDLNKFVYFDQKGTCFINGIKTEIIDETGDEDPLLTVTMITYNHEKYISQAIEGVVSQVTNFKFVLLIGEDYSTDITREIIKSYQKKYPNIIKLKLPERNIGVNANSISNKVLCSGKYIAENEGDDYWTDPYKLQKQVDFLESNSEYSICFHNVDILRNNQVEKDFITKNVNETTDIHDLANGNYIHTPSLLFRNNKYVLEKSKWLLNLKAGDFALNLLNAQFGKIKKLNDTMAVYRIHDTNTWANQPSSSMQLNIFNDLFILSDKFGETVNNILYKRFERVGTLLIYEFLKNNNEEQASEILKIMISKKPDKYLKIYTDSLKVKTGRYHLLEAFKLLRKRLF
jgi:glycosyltransferase involved in cell wall biosynthesis